nr:unnamed protein product [Callosobruchus analis]
MINLFWSNGLVLVYDVKDWVTLRRSHRIIGDIVGTTGRIPSLPVRILPEEALLLTEKGIATMKSIHIEKSDLGEFKRFEEALLAAQAVEYKKTRKKQLESMIDKIVEGRKKNNDFRDAEVILNEELEKSSKVTSSNMLWPIWLTLQTVLPFKLKTINYKDIYLNYTSELKCAVFNDLWSKGYYITEGVKFGGDFLVYYGDPICYHAIFIVKCIVATESISPSEIVAHGRLGTSVRKRFVLASIVDGVVCYVTVNWIDA